MKVYSELIKAQLENSSSALSPTSKGLIYFNTTTGRVNVHNGSGWMEIDSDNTFRQISSNDTLTLYDGIVEVTAAATITLPTAVTCSGKKYIIKVTTASTVTIATTSSEFIDDSLTQVITTIYTAMTVVSNGTKWLIL